MPDTATKAEFERAARAVMAEQPGLTREQLLGAISARIERNRGGTTIGAPPEFTGPRQPPPGPSLAEFDEAARRVLDDPRRRGEGGLASLFAGRDQRRDRMLDMQSAVTEQVGYDRAAAGRQGAPGVSGGQIADTAREGGSPAVIDLLQAPVLEQGIPESLAGMAGYRLAGNPGAAVAAGATGTAHGLLRGESLEDAATRGGWEAALQVALPLFASGLGRVGRKFVGGTLAVTEKEAMDVGRGKLRRGGPEAIRQIADAPGLRPMTKADNLDVAKMFAQMRTNNAANAAAQNPQAPYLDPLQVVNDTYARLGPAGSAASGTAGVVDEFLNMATAHNPQGPLDARQALDILRNRKFTPAGAEALTGQKAAATDLRKTLSEGFKDIAGPEARAGLAEESRLSPLSRIMDRSAFRAGEPQVRQGEVLVSSGKLPRYFGVITPPRGAVFTAGNVMHKTGQALDDSLVNQALTWLLRQGADLAWPDEPR